jgi:hypothetical protein
LRAICVVPPECRLRKQHPKESPQVARIQTATQQLLQNFTDSITHRRSFRCYWENASGVAQWRTPDGFRHNADKAFKAPSCPDRRRHRGNLSYADHS